MKRFLVLMILALGLASTPALAGEKAMCVVCQVKSGETEPEPVRAERMYREVRYGFCSEDCAKEFDSDPEAYMRPVFPRAAPSFRLTSLAGDTLSTESLRGKVVLLDFWATWCLPCRKSMPELNTLHAKYAEQGFTALGVSIDEDGADKVKKFVDSKKLAYPIAIDSEKSPAWTSYRVKAVPAAYLIDRKGQVIAQWLGAPASTKELESKIAAALAEKTE